MKRNAFFVLLATLFLSCQVSNQPAEQELEILASWMTGSFSSQEQSLADSNFFDIRLEMVRIWPEREDGIWMYVEQASAGTLDRPYRQRVYRLSLAGPGLFESKVFELEDPLQYAGHWSHENPLQQLSPEDLTVRPGCSIFLQRADENLFAGSTKGKECLSSHRGAVYAISEVEIFPDRMVTLDMGFDADDNHVWGSAHGGYVFRKTGG
jgi:CpeT protein